MTVRNLDAVFKPRSVALIGASARPGSVGAVTLRNLREGGFRGPILAVNPHHAEIDGLACYPDVASLPETPDVAVIATPPPSVPGLIAELGARGTRGAVVITAGFGEGDSAAGEALQTEMLEAARPHLLRIVGPNCVGVLIPGIGLNASFAHLQPQTGDLALVAQSGAVLVSVLDWAAGRGIGFSHLVSIGDKADVDFGDMLDYLTTESQARAILLYVEAIGDARKFMSAARAAARIKPVVVIKAGRHAAAARAVASHTGALAGSDAVYDAAFRRAGLLRVQDLSELFDAAATLALARPPAGDRLAILTNGGGMGILATDALLDHGGRLAELRPETLSRLDAALPSTWSRGNPVDIIGDANGERYARALAILCEDPEADAVLVINCPTAIASPDEAAEAVIATTRDRRRPVLTSWVGEESGAAARRRLIAAGLPSFETPGEAVRGFMHLVRYRRAQDELMQTPPSLPRNFSVDRAAAERIVGAVVDEGRPWLMGHEAEAVLAAYGVPTAGTRVAATPAEAEAAAASLGGPVALKVVSRDITHKSDVGGVALGLETPAEARAEAEAMAERVRAAAPQARLEGFAVQPMIRRPDAFELIVGASEDAQFGPVLLFGHGGTAVEVIGDKALALPPLNLGLAHEMMARTRVHRLLSGFRGTKPAALDEIALTLVRISQLIVDLDHVAELDINPLLADASGVVALDARMRVARPKRSGVARLAILPYPRELETTIETRTGLRVFVRPVRPEDAPAFAAAAERMSPEALRLRFFTAVKRLPHALLARLTQLDYDREMAFVALSERDAEPPDLVGVVRLAAEPDGERAEYAVTVRSDQAGRGLGEALMRHLLAYARKRGIKELTGIVLRENATMLDLARRLGMTLAAEPGDAGLVRTTVTFD